MLMFYEVCFMVVKEGTVLNKRDILKEAIILISALFFGGCILSKVVTVPMRATGSVISAVPGVGNPVDAVIDEVADTID